MDTVLSSTVLFIFGNPAYSVARHCPAAQPGSESALTGLDITGGNRAKCLKQPDTYWIYNLKATKCPSLNEELLPIFLANFNSIAKSVVNYYCCCYWIFNFPNTNSCFVTFSILGICYSLYIVASFYYLVYLCVSLEEKKPNWCWPHGIYQVE